MSPAIPHAFRVLGLSLVLGASAFAQHRLPEPRALRGVTLIGEPAPRTLLLENGRVHAILSAEESIPPRFAILEAEGLFATPGLLDVWTRAGCETPEPTIDQDEPVDTGSDARIAMRSANRKGIQPAFRAADVFALAPDAAAEHRAAGFAVICSAPTGELLAGLSAAAVTLDTAARDAILRGEVFANASFAASGEGYPSTLMGYQAQLKQFFLDAKWHEELVRRHAAARPGPRPPFDPELEAGRELLARERRVVCAVRSARDVERWLALCERFGFDLIFAGGEDLHEVADRLVQEDVPVILDLDWGEEPEEPEESEQVEAEEEGGEAKDEDETGEDETSDTEESDEISWKYTEPAGVRAEKRRLWEEERASALRLQDAGVKVYFGSGGRDPKDLLEGVRELVELGYPADAALAALTVEASVLLGLGREAGTLEPGSAAHVALWTAEPLSKDAQLRYLFVDGVEHELEVREKRAARGGGDGEGDAPQTDVSGSWQLVSEEDGREIDLRLEMSEDGALRGTARGEAPDGTEVEAEVEGELSGDRLRLSLEFRFGERSIPVELRMTVAGDGDSMEGVRVVTFGDQTMEGKMKGKRQPESRRGGVR